jgi:hypothetical protein
MIYYKYLWFHLQMFKIILKFYINLYHSSPQYNFIDIHLYINSSQKIWNNNHNGGINLMLSV